MRTGLCLACSAMLLQLAVLMQPILPEHLRIALVCQSISEGVLSTLRLSPNLQRLSQQDPISPSHAIAHRYHSEPSLVRMSPLQHDRAQIDALPPEQGSSAQAQQSQHLDAGIDSCLYCTVYTHLFTGLDLSIQQVLVALSIRLLGFKRRFQAVYFALQRLYLFPQGRAPPFSVSVLYA